MTHALEFLRRRVGIVDIEHRDALQPVGMRLAEIGDPVVVDAADLGQQLAVRHAVPEQALARLQHRAPDAVLLVFDDHRMRRRRRPCGHPPRRRGNRSARGPRSAARPASPRPACRPAGRRASRRRIRARPASCAAPSAAPGRGASGRSGSVYMSGGSTMCESAEIILYSAIATSQARLVGAGLAAIIHNDGRSRQRFERCSENIQLGVIRSGPCRPTPPRRQNREGSRNARSCLEDRCHGPHGPGSTRFTRGSGCDGRSSSALFPTAAAIRPASPS